MLKRRLFRLSVAALLLYLSLSFIAGAFVAEGALHPVVRPFTQADENKEALRARHDYAVLSDASVVASDGTLLKAWDLLPDEPNGNAVILLHGLGDNRIGMTGYAVLFLQHGYRVLIPDARAHGLSGGKVATYGLLESNDIRRWFESLAGNQQTRCIYGFGESMGAAQLLQALAAEPRFCAVAAECPFSSFREIAYDRTGQHFNTGDWLGRTVLRPLVESAFLYARWKYHLEMQKVSPEDAVSSTAVPVFLIHDQMDSNIPVRHSRRILAKNHNVVLWEVPGAEHSGAVNAAPDEFDDKVLGWFKDHPKAS